MKTTEIRHVHATPVDPRVGAQPEDAIALHLRARRARAQMIGDLVLRAGRTLVAAFDSLAARFARRVPKRHVGTDVI